MGKPFPQSGHKQQYQKRVTFHGRQTGVSRLALGLFTFRVPFYHTRLCWSEFLQGLFVSAATGLALIPVMTAFFGLSFEEAVALSMIHASLIASIAALKRVFVDDAERFLLEQPIATGLACAYIAMSIPRDNASRGTVVLIGAALAFFEPWMGLLIGVVATLALVGWDRSPDPIPHDE
jgi:hypothetical protein|tara:strand:- start:1056 stop:1589 length:534 start_codon:yes stop_codon:yes gene_type:complete